jgi:hypothetical protein
MTETVDTLGERYAVIEAGHDERFVLSYREEKSLRDLIAAPSIIALGFASREQALSSIEGYLPHVAGRAQVPRATAGNRHKKRQPRCHPIQSGSATWRRPAHTHLPFQGRRSNGIPVADGRLLLVLQTTPIRVSRFHS